MTTNAEIARLVRPHPIAEVAATLGLQADDLWLYGPDIAKVALPVPAAVRQAAVDQEGLRRHPELLRGDTHQAATLRGVLLLSAVILAGAGAVVTVVAVMGSPRLRRTARARLAVSVHTRSDTCRRAT